MRMLLGIEGPVLAGKSTLADNLRRLSPWPLHVAPCYVDYAIASGVELPPVMGGTISEQEAALRTYIDLDRRRYRTLPQSGIVLLDRTLDTLLAHSEGIAAIGGPDVTRIAAEHYSQLISVGLRPSLTFFIETRHTTQIERLTSRRLMPTELVDPTFNQAFQNYFERSRAEEPQRLMFFQAELDPIDLACSVLEALKVHVKMDEL